MAGKIKTVYVCQECGYETPKWMGQCPNCNEWNTLEEQVISDKKATGFSAVSSSVKAIASAESLSQIDITDK